MLRVFCFLLFCLSIARFICLFVCLFLFFGRGGWEPEIGSFNLVAVF